MSQAFQSGGTLSLTLLKPKPRSSVTSPRQPTVLEISKVSVSHLNKMRHKTICLSFIVLVFLLFFCLLPISSINSSSLVVCSRWSAARFKDTTISMKIIVCVASTVAATSTCNTLAGHQHKNPTNSRSVLLSMQYSQVVKRVKVGTRTNYLLGFPICSLSFSRLQSQCLLSPVNTAI